MSYKGLRFFFWQFRLERISWGLGANDEMSRKREISSYSAGLLVDLCALVLN